MKNLLNELQEIKKLLQIIVSNQEPKIKTDISTYEIKPIEINSKSLELLNLAKETLLKKDGLNL